MSKVYTVKTIDGNRYRHIPDNENYFSIGNQMLMREKWLRVCNMTDGIVYFNVDNIVYIKEESDGEEEKEG